MEDDIRLEAPEPNPVSTDQKGDWTAEIEEELQKLKNIVKETQPDKKLQPEKRGKTIRKIPANFKRKEPNDLYAPCKVSFGPYHHGKESCRSTEAIKKVVVAHSLKRSNKKLEDYKEALSKVLKDLKDKYDEPDSIRQQDDDGFLKMMIYDGCFFLEILRAATDSSYNHISDSPIWDKDPNNRQKLLQQYRHDMLLLENQLPLLVLEKLFEIQNDKPKNFILDKIQKVGPRESLNEHILKFFFPRIKPEIPTKKCLHVLDLYRHSLLYEELRRESKVQGLWRIMDSVAMQIISRLTLLTLLFLLAPVIWVILALVDIICFLFILLTYIFKTQQAIVFHFTFPSALDLNRVGIGFMSKTKGLTDISYGRRTLRLPKIYVDGQTRSMFVNIIAFERLHEDAENEVISYIYFMSNLIKGVGDVRHLQNCGVIVTEVHTPNEIIKLFNNLNKDIDVHDPRSFVVPRYRNVSERLINGFYKMNKPWRKDLWQTYLRSPWALVSILAAFFLFSLTIIQTVYTVLSYYKSN